MHYSINPDDIKAETENLGHKVANIWNIKQFRTKLPPSVFFVDLKLLLTIRIYSVLNSFNNVKLNLNHQDTNERLPIAVIVNAIGTQKIIATYNHVVSNVPGNPLTNYSLTGPSASYPLSPKFLKSSFSNASFRWLNIPTSYLTISSASDRGTPQFNKLIVSSAC
jgi:hypothetical protein